MKQSWVEIINQPHISKAINPRRWGNGQWNFVDSIVFAYPIVPNAADQEKIAQYIHALAAVLPCPSCASDFSRMLEEDPIERHLHSREALARWVNAKHNAVNAKLGKPYFAFEDYVLKFGKSPPLAQATQSVAQRGHGQFPPMALSVVDAPPLLTGGGAQAGKGGLTLVWVLLAVAALGGLFLLFRRRKMS